MARLIRVGYPGAVPRVTQRKQALATKTRRKPESITLAGFLWRSETGYAETSHVSNTKAAVNAALSSGWVYPGAVPRGKRAWVTG